MIKFILLFFSLFIFLGAQSQTDDTTLLFKYNKGYHFLETYLKTDGKFLTAVFEVEKIFNETNFLNDYSPETLSLLSELSRLHYLSNHDIPNYKFLDRENFAKNFAIFSTITDTTFIVKDTNYTYFLPFKYSFNDPEGRQDWDNMFVTKLLATHQGNCHSLAYLYKILADEIGAKCWLSLAPGHIYIKNYSDKIGWYNTELTSGTFPTDAWVMVTGYITPEAIKSGLYMDTLSNQQSIALCVLDLAKEYEFQTHNYYDGFIVKCCDLVLQYHPVNPMALLLKAETLKKVWLRETETKFPKPTSTALEMQNAYITLTKLGYREMPEKMYQQWVKSIDEQRNKYENKKIIKPVPKK